MRLKEEQLRREEEKVRESLYLEGVELKYPFSCARSNFVSNERSMKRDRNCLRRRSLSGDASSLITGRLPDDANGLCF